MVPFAHAQTLPNPRVTCAFQQQPGQVALDQLRVVDTVRLVKQLAQLEEAIGRAVLGKMFAC